MDFVERAFGISPDAGSGFVELLLIAIPVMLVAAFYLKRRQFR